MDLRTHLGLQGISISKTAAKAAELWVDEQLAVKDETIARLRDELVVTQARLARAQEGDICTCELCVSEGGL